MFFRTVAIVLTAAAAGANADRVGQGTFFAPGLGACGHLNHDADHIVAVSAKLFDSFPGHTANPNNNPICNKAITINFKGKTVQAVVTDKCAGCAGLNDLDMTPAVFNKLANPAVGRISGVHWHFNK